MNFTEREVGAIRMACTGMLEWTRGKNEIATKMLSEILAILDRADDWQYTPEDDAKNWRPEDYPEKRLPDVPDWRDGAAQFAAEDKIARMRLTVASAQGELLSDIIRQLTEQGTSQRELARMLKVNPARVNEALHGHATPAFIARFAETFGVDGKAGE